LDHGTPLHKYVVDPADTTPNNLNKGNNKLTELRAILQKGKSKLISI